MIIGGEKNFSGKVLFFSPYPPPMQKSRAVTVFPIIPDYN